MRKQNKTEQKKKTTNAYKHTLGYKNKHVPSKTKTKARRKKRQ